MLKHGVFRNINVLVTANCLDWYIRFDLQAIGKCLYISYANDRTLHGFEARRKLVILYANAVEMICKPSSSIPFATLLVGNSSILQLKRNKLNTCHYSL